MFVQQIKMHSATLFRKHLHHWLQCNEFRILKHILGIHIPQHKLIYDRQQEAKPNGSSKKLKICSFSPSNITAFDK